MQNNTQKHKNKCTYCGDAPIPHMYSYIGSLIGMFVDPFFGKMSKWVPKFAIVGVEYFLKLLFHILRVLKIVRLSSDREKAVSLRSRVIWDEATRRGIKMEQVVVFGKPTDNYRAKVKGEYIYFDSLPIPVRPFGDNTDWDDKFFMKEIFSKENIPTPAYVQIPVFKKDREKLFNILQKPLIVKPRTGSRGRHTTTNIYKWEEFDHAFKIAKKISFQVVAEEHLSGYVCRATCVGGKLAGFYRAEPASVIGDGLHTIQELVALKNINRPTRVAEVVISKEIDERLARLGMDKNSILKKDLKIELSHRTGRYFGGSTREMIDELDQSFVPILEHAAKVTTLSVVGMDCIIPDPESMAEGQRWGIIECNTLPFIDLHYFALDGKPKNIAGMIWDFWK